MISLTLDKLFILIPPLLLLEGIFSGSEIALLSADKLTLQKWVKEGNVRAKLALHLAKHPESVLSATLLMTSLCVISISASIEIYCIRQNFPHTNVITLLVTSPLIVLFGELIPKMVFQKHATRLAQWVAYPVHWAFLLFYPITKIISFYTIRISRAISNITDPLEELVSGKKRTTRDEIESLLTYTKKETEIKSAEKQMIKRILDFRDSQAQHALIPLVRVDAIEEGATLQDALGLFEKHRHSRMPVYQERIDNIVGILEISDLLTATESDQNIRSFITPAHYVAETQSLHDIMLNMRSENAEMVIVVDEHGGAMGILTVEDIVEEVVGEISDEYDYEFQPYKQVSESTWVVQASMEIQQMNEIIKLSLPEGNYETLSGFLLQQFGRIPEAKDELFFNTASGHYRFTIQTATERHIEVVVIRRL